jgi:hypothetical protein
MVLREREGDDIVDEEHLGAEEASDDWTEQEYTLCMSEVKSFAAFKSSPVGEKMMAVLDSMLPQSDSTSTTSAEMSSVSITTGGELDANSFVS